MAGDVSVSESNTLMTPRFSATNTRPSLAKRTAVGFVRPLMTTDSLKPAGRVAACATAGAVRARIPDPVSISRLSRSIRTRGAALVKRDADAFRRSSPASFQ